LKTETHSFTFDKQLKHGTGKLYAANFYPNHQHVRGEIDLPVTTMSFKEYNCLLGHENKCTVMDTAAHHNIVLTQNTKDPCPHSVKAKNRMKNTSKQVNNPYTREMERLLIDLSWIKTASFAAKRYWLLVMDDYTNFIWSFFLMNKNDVADTMIAFLLQLQKETKLNVEFIRYASSG
jgi:hypothetical protein